MTSKMDSDSFNDVNDRTLTSKDMKSTRQKQILILEATDKTSRQLGDTFKYSEDRSDLEGNSSSNLNDRASMSKITSSRQR